MNGRDRNCDCLTCLHCRARALYSWDARVKVLTQLDDLRSELRLARQHLLNCATAQAVADHDSDKRREDI